MKKIIMFFLGCLSINAQFNQNFENLPNTIQLEVNGWKVLNNKDNESSWGLYANDNYFPRTGKNCAMIVKGKSSGLNDDYLITPKISVTQAVNDQLSYWISTVFIPDSEKYSLLKLSTNNPTEEDLNNQSNVLVNNENIEYQWKFKTIDLRPYIGQDIYLAFKVTDLKGGIKVDDVINNTYGTLSTDIFSTDLFQLYPNPVIDHLKISSQSQMKSISLFNLFGEEIYSRNINSIEHNLDLSNLKAGVYFLKINSGKQTKTTKIIKS
ncbi:hypothetical protein B0A78_00515 [Flavobacterium columnare NBRC 100251 = ATCC 23463]|uniref:T9SS-dependent choice-of-anchor J family protein n=2 Tax=Flavobacterium columnare TaxID=996 RepID=UPI0007FB1D07|nr:choice-of-anchor J domain-containing protein [Flavobacterium columnare]APT23388.1 hypothetical protein BU993_12600 [Flavobacterium columnare]PDS27242.1 hypothetical protein B0A78_00515 [Flavobacterium columnare NBRC 100251 = ATCC 23463]